MHELIDIANKRQEAIHAWLDEREAGLELPLYASVDIRDAGFKVATVDMNLFPAGFNNLCEHGVEDAVIAMGRELQVRVPGCRQILIIAEEHTRNTWYLDNIRVLQNIIRTAGYEAMVATFLEVQPAFCEKVKFVELETATGETVRLYCMQQILKEFHAGKRQIDMIIMNNDLTSGIPKSLRDEKIPIYPSIHMGWHSRLKSHHFQHASDLITEFADMIDVDPWQLQCMDAVVDDININDEDDRNRLQGAASDLFSAVGDKYREHEIDEKPFIFLKADSGTYGMGVKAIEDPAEIPGLGRRARNSLYKGKSSRVISRFLLQEGVPTISTYGDQVAEACLYTLANDVVGGFYRLHGEKNSRESLNSRGMSFQAICPHLSKYGVCGVHTENNIFDVYRIIARIAGIAAHREMVQLERQSVE